MKEALHKGKGAIGLSAHLGNYELAGAVLSLSGIKVNAVVLTHRNRWVDSFFSRQRKRVGVKMIPVQQMRPREFLEACLSTLASNEVLALVGDRDFFDRGMELPFFEKKLKVPRGPASFALRSHCPIIPSFLVRESDGRYRFFLEPPLVARPHLPAEKAEEELLQACLQVMAKYIRRYPTQWYMFQEFWRPGRCVIV